MYLHNYALRVSVAGNLFGFKICICVAKVHKSYLPFNLVPHIYLPSNTVTNRKSARFMPGVNGNEVGVIFCIIPFPNLYTN